jgi:hypothetical protein
VPLQDASSRNGISVDQDARLCDTVRDTCPASRKGDTVGNIGEKKRYIILEPIPEETPIEEPAPERKKEEVPA